MLNIWGHDRPAVTSSVSTVLSTVSANILDIGQAVIHDKLSLGMLVEFPSGVSVDSQLVLVKDALQSLSMDCKFQEIDEQSYQDWVQQQGKQRHIVTLLSRQITAQQLSQLTRVMADHELNIDNISRLTGRVPLSVSIEQGTCDTTGAAIDQVQESVEKQTRACVEFSARGWVGDVQKLRADFAELASRLDVDIAFQEDNMFRRTRRLVCFDMDSTLIEAEVIDELAKAVGSGDAVADITEAAMRGELDFNESFTRRMALLKGLDESVLADIAKNLPVTEGAERLVSTLGKLGYKTAILSGGFQYFGEYLQKRLGIDYVFANELEIKAGKVTGKVTGRIVDGERKAELLKQLAKQENIQLEQVVAVGDGANDLPMLSIAGLGIAFRAKPLVQAEAKQSISTLGLDAILYLMGFRDRDIK